MSKDTNSYISYYNEFKDKIYHYFLYRIGLDKPLAEDLTSEVFIKAFKNFSSFDKTKKFQPWIYMIAHNHLVNHYKSAKQTVSLDDVAPYLGDSGTQAETRYEMNRVLRIIDSLPESDRDIIRFKFIDGLASREISELLGREEGAIRTQLSRSLHKLRGIINGNSNLNEDNL